jgi:soluble lytic murein transglycosylase-like protein
LAAYLGEPTAALAYEGTLPYPGDEKLIPAILAETANTSGTTPYDIAIIKMGMATRIDPRFVRAIAKILSACKPDYVSPDGRRGLIPLRRQQWEMAARALNLNWSFDTESGDPEKNVRLSYGYLQWLRSDCLRPYAGTRLDHLERIYGNLGIGKQAD